jgi:hypothetical protein
MSSKVQVVQRVRAHALLPVGLRGELSFDHEEFLHYFLAARLAIALRTRDSFGFQRFAEVHPFPEAVSLWAANIEGLDASSSRDVVGWLSMMSRAETRSSYLRQNIGSIAAHVAQRGGLVGGESYSFDNMYFEGPCWRESVVRKGIFTSCSFLNLDLTNTRWVNCIFRRCRIDGLILNTATDFEGSSFDEDTVILGVLRRKSDDDEYPLKSYVPDECALLLEQRGACFPETISINTAEDVESVPSEVRKCLDVFFRIFARNTGANENVTKVKLGPRYHFFKKEILPPMLKFKVIKPTQYYGNGQQERWELCFPIETILKAEDPHSATPATLREFWNELRP